VDVASYTLDEARFVRSRHSVLARARKGFEEQGGAEHLRSLRQDHAFARNRGRDEGDVVRQARALHFLHRVHRRNPKDGCVAGGCLRDYAFDLVECHERPDRVVHQNQVGFGRDFRERVGDGILARIAAANHADRPAKIFRSDAGPQGIDFLRSRGNDEIRDGRASRKTPQREEQHRHAVQREKLLWRVGAHSGS